MLARKMLREIKANKGQFISIWLLSFLAVFVFAAFYSEVVGCRNAVKEFGKDTNLADAWIYSEGFSEADLEAVRALDFVEDAQLRTELKGTAPDQDGVQTNVYIMDESLVIVPRTVEGEDFDPQDEEGIWLNASFADAWDISLGDSFRFEYNGMTFEKPVKGLIMTPEYAYTRADNDSDINLKNLAYVYVGKAGVEHSELLPNTTLLITLTDEGRDYAISNRSKSEKNDNPALFYEPQIAEALGGNYSVMIDKSSIEGIQKFDSELDQHETFSYGFSVVFVVIAMLVIATSMSRLVERQRTQIGTMNAIGMKKHKIVMHYMSYSFIVSLTGAAVGLIAGPILADWLIDIVIDDWYIVPDLHASLSPMCYILAAAIVVLCTGTSYFSCRKLMKVHPAEALRPASPKKARRNPLERFAFWNKLSFSTAYNLRDVFRYPMRALMGIVGTCVGMVLILYSFGCYVLVDQLVEWNFDRIQTYDYEMVLSGDQDLTYYDSLADEVDGELIMQDFIEIATEVGGDDKSKQNITVIEGNGLFNITGKYTEITRMKLGYVAITNRLAKSMGVGVGDKIYWHIYSKNTWYESEIGLINRTPDTAGITILREDLEAAGCEFVPGSIVTKTDVTDYENTPGVSAVYNMAKLKDSFEEGFEVINALVGVMASFSIITIVVVLYNSGNLSFHERLKEFATLKVMGLHTRSIRKILNQENIWFAVIGIVLGIPWAQPLLIEMMNSNGENFDYYMTIPVYLYVCAAAFVLLVSLAVSFLFSRRIRDLDMVGTLKGIE